MSFRQDGLDALLSAIQKIEESSKGLSSEEIAHNAGLSLEVGDTGTLPFCLSKSVLLVSKDLNQLEQRRWILYTIYLKCQDSMQALPEWTSN